MTTRRGGDDPILMGLRQADCTLSLAARIGGPRRWRSSLADRHGVDELDPAQIEAALEQLSAVQRIADPKVRRVLVEALSTDGCRQVRTLREIALAAGVPQSSVRRLLRIGLDAVRNEFRAREAA